MIEPSSHLFRVAVWASSDIGCVRENNEDAFGFDESLGIFVVCDGMGGLDSGEVASSRAVAAILSSFRSTAQTEATVGSRIVGQRIGDDYALSFHRHVRPNAFVAPRFFTRFTLLQPDLALKSVKVDLFGLPVASMTAVHRKLYC